MISQHHQLNGHEFEQTLGDSERQGSLVCCGPRGCKESDMTYQLNNNSKYVFTSQVSGTTINARGTQTNILWFLPSRGS